MMIQDMKDTLNGKKVNTQYLVLYYVMIALSITCNFIIVFGNRPFHAFFTGKKFEYGLLELLLDLMFLATHMISSSFCQLCFIDMCLTRIAKYRRRGKVESGISFGLYPKEWTPLAFLYFMISELAFATIIITNLYGRFLHLESWSNHTRGIILAVGMSSLLVTLGGMIVLGTVTFTVPYWKSTIKRNASISDLGKERF